MKALLLCVLLPTMVEGVASCSSLSSSADPSDPNIFPATARTPKEVMALIESPDLVQNE